ncbi:AraC family transcriptional regulator [Mesorhizobium sp. CGMCC 1.15528]|uniref:AraC family transcriptional regulator n=1 Tax=Mesorhizobium zhangyense TaxID=1776730 RepID=A0A7C9VA49_9HYPH|nr:AraC family transcriptional regulator [Mesorhizobium zhangyense]NGN40152.1 AraC family transcriptional regulator [Mesorhizobium zhangyense]
MPAVQFRMLRCRTAGVQAVEAATRHAFTRHWHEQYGIGVIHQGAQKSLSGRGMVESVRGDTVTVNPGEVHDGMPLSDAGRSWRMLYFDPAVIQNAFSDMSEGASKDCEFVWPTKTDAEVASLFHRLYAAITEDGPDLLREELLLRLLAGVLRERDEPAALHATPMAIMRARQLIDDEPVAAVTLAELARQSGMSRFQVLRGFARATGFTPHAYLMQRRADLARRLIAQGTPLAEAAAGSGFADQSHMTRTFARKYGISPGAYAATVA